VTIRVLARRWSYARPMASRVLVVDDDATVRDVVARYLGDAGYAVDLAADGHAGLDAATRGEPDAVVLDLMLPGLSGLEVCRALRLREVPPAIVMLTALGEEQDRVLGLEFGADDYVTKPFSPRELVLRVGSVLRRAVPAVGGHSSTAGCGWNGGRGRRSSTSGSWR
jgi:DNA-binding response OmpR family regulator